MAHQSLFRMFAALLGFGVPFFASTGLFRADAQEISAPTADTGSKDPVSDIIADEKKARLLAVSNDEKSAIIYDGAFSALVVDLESCTVTQRLPAFHNRGWTNSGNNPTPHGKRFAQFSSETNLAWTLKNFTFKSESEIKSIERSIEANREYLSEEQLWGEFGNPDELRARKHGAYLKQWNLVNGEEVKRLIAPKRSILAFREITKQQRLLVTAEGRIEIVSEDGHKHLVLWICVYDSERLTKLYETKLLVGLSKLPELAKLHYDKPNDHLYTVVCNKYFQFDMKDGLRLNSQRSLIEDPASIRNTVFSNKGLYFCYSKWTDAHGDGVVVNFHATPDSQPNNNVQAIADSDQFAFSLPSNQTLFSASDESLFISGKSWDDVLNPVAHTHAIDPTTGTSRPIDAKWQLEHRLSTGKFVSAKGTHDEDGKLLEPFVDYATATQTISPQQRTITTERVVLATTSRTILEATSVSLILTPLESDAPPRVISLQSLVDPNAVGSMQLRVDRIQAAYSEKEQCYILAIPRSQPPTEQDITELAKVVGSVSNETADIFRTQIASETQALIAETALGPTWLVLKLREDDGEAKQIDTIGQSPCIKLTEFDGHVAMLNASRMRNSLEITNRVGLPDSQQLFGVRAESARQHLARELHGRIEGLASGSEYFVNSARIALSCLSLYRNCDLVGCKSGLLLTDSSLFNKHPGGATLRLIDNSGHTLKSRSVSFSPKLVQELKASGFSGAFPGSAAIASSSQLSLSSLFIGQDQDSIRSSWSGASAANLKLPKAIDFGLRLYMVDIDSTEQSDRLLDAGWLLPGINSLARAKNAKPSDLPDSLIMSADENFLLASYRSFAGIEKAVLYDIACREPTLTVTGGGLPKIVGNQLVLDGLVANLDDIKARGMDAFDGLLTLERRPGIASSARDTFDAECYFLGVGTNTFNSREFPKLGYAEFDIKALAELFGDKASRNELRFNPILLLGDRLSAEAVGTAFADIQRNSTVKDTVVICAASHGVRLNRGLFVATHSCDLQSMQATAVGWPEFVESISKIKAKRIIVFLDVCHAEAFSEANLPILESIERELSHIPGLIIFAASQANEAALELDGIGHGAFTKSLISVLNESNPFQFDPAVVEEKLVASVEGLTQGQQRPVLILANAERKNDTALRDHSDTINAIDSRSAKEHGPSIKATHTVIQSTQLKSGKDVMATLSRGAAVQLRREQDGWWLVAVEVDGERELGWVRPDSVQPIK